MNVRYTNEASVLYRYERDNNFFFTGLSQEQDKALYNFILNCVMNNIGGSWKSELNNIWLKAGAPGHLQSIRNRIGPRFLYDHQKGIPELNVGDGVTILGYSDRYACSVTHVTPSGRIKCREDNAKKSGEDSYLYTFNPGGKEYKFSWRKGIRRYCESGTKGNVVSFGRDKYRDPDF